MTETSILPGSTPAPDANIDMVPPSTGDEDIEGGGGDRRRIMILGGIVGLLVIVAAAYLLLHKGSSSSSDSFVPTSTHTAPSAPTGGGKSTAPKGGSSTAPKGGKASPTTVPKKAHKPQVRDPFNALITAPVAGTGGGTGTTVVNPTPTPTTSSTTPTGTTSSPPVSTTTPPASGGGVTGPPLSIQLMSVKGDTATFHVFYTHHKFKTFEVTAPSGTATQGTTFAKVFALLGIEGKKATIQIGDDTPFDLARGVAHTV